MAGILTSPKRAANWLLPLVLLFPVQAAADERSDAVEASRHFERGYLMAQQGSLELAIREFESAYALRPHPSVLYNLGQAYAASGRAVQAVQTLTKYLQQADPKIDAERRAQVDALIDYQNQRVGALIVEVEPAGAELVLDGVSLGQAPLAGPVPVTAGVHGLTVTAPGRAPQHLSLEIAGKNTLKQQVRLSPVDEESLFVSCDVPDVHVTADGAHVGSLPRGGRITVPGNTSALRFERRGFIPVTVPLPAAAELIDCGLGALAADALLVPVTLSGPASLIVRVNGRPFRGGALPAGRHVVSLSGHDLESTERIVQVSGGAKQRVTLTSTDSPPSLVSAHAMRRRLHLYSALVSAGVGVAGLGVAGVMYAINRDAYASWRRDGTDLAQRSSAMPGSVNATEWNRLLERENTLRNRDSVALGAGLLGGAFVIAGGALWLTAPAPAIRNVTVQIGKVSWVAYSSSF